MDAVKAKATQLLNSITQDDLQHCFQQWKIRTERCRDRGGDYTEGDNTSIVWFFFNKGLEHESGFFIATPCMSATSTNFNLWYKVLLDKHLSLFSPQTSNLFLEIHVMIIIPSKSRSSMTCPCFRFHHHNHICISILSHTCHMPCSFRSFNIIKRKTHKSWILSKCQHFLQSSVTSIIMQPNIFLNTLFSNILSPHSYLNLKPHPGLSILPQHHSAM